MTMHLDQTLSKFIPGSISPQVKIGPTTVLIAGSSEKKAVQLTFVINLNEAFFLFQAIYEGKTTRCLPRVEFPESFCLNFNEKHWDNEKENLKII